MTAYSVVRVTLTDRADGGLRVHSEDLPGLVLSGPSQQQVCERIAPAIKALLEHKGIQVVSVSAGQSMPEVLGQGSPRDLDMHIQHGIFVVVLAKQADVIKHHRAA